MKIKKIIINLIPLSIGIFLAWILGWWGFWVIFPWIGGWISIGCFIAIYKKGKDKDLGRRISILMISPVFLIFLGVFQHENLQLEETVFYIAAGYITRVLIHYIIAKILGPFIWGRGFCGWACWTAAILEWLPIKENRAIPKKYTHIRYIVLVISILIPILFIQFGYDFFNNHIYGDSGNLFQHHKTHQLIWFLVGNGIYYATAIPLAFIFKKKRAFCKIACPVALIMKLQTRVALIKLKPTDNECIECGTCNKNCPMDVDVMFYIKNGKSITSTECILCDICRNVCPVNAIK